jgi:copper chaperone CopZ
MKVLSLVLLLLLSMAVVVHAETITYVMTAPGIITDENAAAARAAALAVKGVVSAEAFVATHTIEIEVIDAGVSLDEVSRAINAAGYTVGKPRVKKDGR